MSEPKDFFLGVVKKKKKNSQQQPGSDCGTQESLIVKAWGPYLGKLLLRGRQPLKINEYGWFLSKI